MKKIVIILFISILGLNNVHAKEVQPTAEQIYNNCEILSNHKTRSDAIDGNIDDVQNARRLRKCLKDKIIEISISELQEDEIDVFVQTLNNFESNAEDIYRPLIFCTKNLNNLWCKQRPYDDMSIEKLIFEKHITAQIYTILETIIEQTADNNY